MDKLPYHKIAEVSEPCYKRLEKLYWRVNRAERILKAKSREEVEEILKETWENQQKG